MPTKKELLKSPIQHIDIKQHNVVPMVDAMGQMAYSARDTARAADIYDMMLRDTDCGVILCLAGSLISAGLKKIFVDLIRNNMVDAIVSTGANIVDQDFFEALGFKHYIAGDEYKYGAGDADLRELMIDRIYDTFIDEEELRICDETTHQITNSLEPRPYSSREFIREMGAYLAKNGKTPQAEAATPSSSPPTRRTSPSSAPPSPTAPPASASSPTSTSARASRRSPSTPPRTSTR